MSKIMFFDIETSPNVCYSWRIGYNINLTPDNIVEERKIMCICWKYAGEDATYALTWDKNHDDKKMLAEFNRVIQECDVAIGHNGDKFDLKWVKTRNIFHKLPPINNVITVDTLKLARNQFNFNSNKLDYIGDMLGVGRKTETGGYSLWTRVLSGEKKALNEMVEYCRNDVVLLEDVYNAIRPYVDRTPIHMGMLKHNDRLACPSCGCKKVYKSSKVTLRTGTYQRYKCTECGHIYRDSRKLRGV